MHAIFYNLYPELQSIALLLQNYFHRKGFFYSFLDIFRYNCISRMKLFMYFLYLLINNLNEI